MKFDPKDTEAFRERTKQDTLNLGTMRTKLCVACKKLRSIAQFVVGGCICKQCKRRA